MNKTMKIKTTECEVCFTRYMQEELIVFKRKHYRTDRYVIKVGHQCPKCGYLATTKLEL